MTQIAVASELKKLAEKAKKDLSAGEYPIDEVVKLRVKGLIVRGKDGTTKPTSKIPLKLTLALCFEKLGIMREVAEEIIVDSITEAIKLQEFYKENPDEGDEDDIETPSDIIGWRLKDLEKALKRVSDMTDKLPEIPKRGQTRFKGIVEEIA